MAKLLPEAILLKNWRRARGLSLNKAAAELSALRGYPVYKHQILHWERGAGMNEGTKGSIRAAMAKVSRAAQ